MSYRTSGFALVLSTFATACYAGSVDVTSSEFITLAQGATVEFGFNVASFAHNSGTYNPYPTGLNFQILGDAVAGQPATALPGSSQQYDPQFALDATLTSADGSSSVSLVNSAATRLGLAAGSMVVTNGMLQSAQNTNVNIINASVQLTAQESALIFGTNIASASDMAYVVLHNDGPALVLGLGAGYNLQSAMVVSGVTGAAPLSTGGLTEQVLSVTATPEPVTYANTAGGLALLAGFAFYQRARTAKAFVA